MNTKPFLITLAILSVVAIAVIFITNTPNKSNTPIITTPITVTTSAGLVYKNTTYDFQITLPKTWNDFKIQSSEILFGNSVVIIHPDYTTLNPRMNIPILIYPIEKWTEWEKNNFEGYPITAPIGPTERGRNTRFVFATAPRYNFIFLTGFEEVEIILKTLK